MTDKKPELVVVDSKKEVEGVAAAIIAEKCSFAELANAKLTLEQKNAISRRRLELIRERYCRAHLSTTPRPPWDEVRLHTEFLFGLMTISQNTIEILNQRLQHQDAVIQKQAQTITAMQHELAKYSAEPAPAIVSGNPANMRAAVQMERLNRGSKGGSR